MNIYVKGAYWITPSDLDNPISYYGKLLIFNTTRLFFASYNGTDIQLYISIYYNNGQLPFMYLGKRNFYSSIKLYLRPFLKIKRLYECIY